MSKEVFYEGRFADKSEYFVYGHAENGPAQQIDSNISQIGQDATVVLPEYNLAGVFDGAGGATDIGSPEQASLTASDAVRIYLKKDNQARLGDVMEYARQAVITDPTAGVCVGALIRLHGMRAEMVNAGDTGIATYNTINKDFNLVAEQQIEDYEPSNYLGRSVARLPKRSNDLVAEYDVMPGDDLYVMSDGALGQWSIGRALEEYHFESAYDDYPLLATAIQNMPNLEDNIRKLLKTDKARQLMSDQLCETHYYSKEIENPALFSIHKMDWDIWHEIVRPYIEENLKVKPSRPPHARDYLASLVAKPISWDFERPYDDDATIIKLSPSS